MKGADQVRCDSLTIVWDLARPLIPLINVVILNAMSGADQSRC